VIVLTSNPTPSKKHPPAERPHERENMVRRFTLIDSEFRPAGAGVSQPSSSPHNMDFTDGSAEGDHRATPADVSGDPVRDEFEPSESTCDALLADEMRAGRHTIDDLQRDGRTSWEGVATIGAQLHARRQCRWATAFLFYASNADRPAHGVRRQIARRRSVDRASGQPIWHMVDIGVRRFIVCARPLKRTRRHCMRRA